MTVKPNPNFYQPKPNLSIGEKAVSQPAASLRLPLTAQLALLLGHKTKRGCAPESHRYRLVSGKGDAAPKQLFVCPPHKVKWLTHYSEADTAAFVLATRLFRVIVHRPGLAQILAPLRPEGTVPFSAGFAAKIGIVPVNGYLFRFTGIFYCRHSVGMV